MLGVIARSLLGLDAKDACQNPISASRRHKQSTVSIESSTRLDWFIEKPGSDRTWELVALPPRYLQKQLRQAIESNIYMDTFSVTTAAELNDADRLGALRKKMINDLDFQDLE